MTNIVQADIRELLTDREWHSLPELVHLLKVKIAPERAAQVYINMGARNTEKAKQIRKSEPYENQIAKGRRIIVERTVSGLCRKNLAERRGERNAKEYRLLEWYCVSCGMRQTEDEGNMLFHLCDRCLDILKR